MVLEDDLHAAENYQVVSVTRIRRAQSILEPLKAEIEDVLHITIQVPVRPEVDRLRAIRLGRAVGDLQVGEAEFQLPRAPACLIRLIAEEVMLWRDRPCIRLRLA